MRESSNLLFSESHEWVELLEDGTAYVGISDYAQDAMGDLVFVNLPEVGDEILCGESFADLESVKAVSDVFSPLTGTVEEINEELLDAPEAINESPYESWFVKVKDITEKADLMTEAEYLAFVETLED